jgi:5-formyltetrahydrofolate cyclo-ligase
MPSKQELRRKMNSLKPLPAETFNEGLDACAIKDLPCWIQHKTILLFLSIQFEIDTASLLDMAFLDRKDVFVPKIIDSKMRFFKINSTDGPWKEGSFRIREPYICNKELNSRHFPALVITPGLAFDKTGGRLGRGGGFYDHFFSEMDNLGLHYFRLGLCMRAQLVQEVPIDVHDKKMDAVWAGSLVIDKNLSSC